MFMLTEITHMLSLHGTIHIISPIHFTQTGQCHLTTDGVIHITDGVDIITPGTGIHGIPGVTDMDTVLITDGDMAVVTVIIPDGVDIQHIIKTPVGYMLLTFQDQNLTIGQLLVQIPLEEQGEHPL